MYLYLLLADICVFSSQWTWWWEHENYHHDYLLCLFLYTSEHCLLIWGGGGYIPMLWEPLFHSLSYRHTHTLGHIRKNTSQSAQEQIVWNIMRFSFHCDSIAQLCALLLHKYVSHWIISLLVEQIHRYSDLTLSISTSMLQQTIPVLCWLKRCHLLPIWRLLLTITFVTSSSCSLMYNPCYRLNSSVYQLGPFL